MGMGLGFAASIVTSWVYFFVYTLLTSHDILGIFSEVGPFYSILILLLGTLAFGLILALFSFVPATLGGGLVGLFSDQLASFRRLTKPSIIILGALIGVAVGLYMAAFVIFIMQEDSQNSYLLAPHANPWLLGTIGGLVGIAHSWILARWIEKRAWDAGDEVGLIGLHRKKIAGFLAGGIAAGFLVVTVSGDKSYDAFRFPLQFAGIAALGGLFANWVLGALLRWRLK